MAVTPGEILARGKGPVQPTFVDQATPATATAPQSKGQTGIENVRDAMHGASNNPQNPSEVVERGVINVANPQTTTDVEQVTAVDEQQKGSPVVPKLSYTEMYEKMSPYKPPTPEDLEKERKRQKREAIFAAIGDGISAMSNLYFTTQYAPNAFDPTAGMAATTKARFDKLKKDREANHREYMAGYLRAMKMDADQAKDERNYLHTIEREKITDGYKMAAEARAQAKADRDAAMAKLRIDQQTAAARAKDIEANYAEEYWASRINKNNYRTPVGSRSSGGGTSKKYPVFNADGDVIDHVYTKDEAISETERNGGTYPGQTRDQSRTQQNGRRKKTTTTSTTTTPHAGRQPRKQKKANPMTNSNGRGSDGKKRNPMS